jgi:hypothetical protein
MDCPMIIFHIVIEISGAPPLMGLRLRISSVGGSVANARAARESLIGLIILVIRNTEETYIIRLIQRSCTAVRTDRISLSATEEMKVKSTAVMLTVI